MDLQLRRYAGIDLLEKLQPLNMAVAWLALADDAPIQNIERGNQWGRSMALVVVRHGLDASTLERQARLCAVKRLHLTLLVTAQHNSPFGRVLVRAHDISVLSRVPKTRANSPTLPGTTTTASRRLTSGYTMCP